MATIHKEVTIEASPDEVWDAIRDYGAVHERVARGFVLDTVLDGDARVVTFANGFSAREVLVTLDDEARRLAYSMSGGPLTHHNASTRIYPDGHGGTRFVWTADILPDELAPVVDSMMEEGAQAAKRTLECQAVAADSSASSG